MAAEAPKVPAPPGAAGAGRLDVCALASRTEVSERARAGSPCTLGLCQLKAEPEARWTSEQAIHAMRMFTRGFVHERRWQEDRLRSALRTHRDSAGARVQVARANLLHETSFRLRAAPEPCLTVGPARTA